MKNPTYRVNDRMLNIDVFGANIYADVTDFLINEKNSVLKILAEDVNTCFAANTHLLNINKTQ